MEEMPSLQPIIELKNVSFIAQNETIIRDFSMAFAAGSATALVGPSGCGKSTALKLAAGLLVPTKGQACYWGKDISSLNRLQNLAFRQDAAMVFQDSALWANQDIYQILELPLRIHFPQLKPQARDARIKEVASQVGYRKALAIRPAKLSMGEQKLIGFARALLCKPSIYFLDEWTESLDDESAGRLFDIAKSLKESGHTILFISHDLETIRNLADTVVMINDGQKIMELSGKEISDDARGANLIERGMNSCDSEYALLIR